MNQETLFILLLLLAVFEAAPELFRTKWTKQQAVISAMEMGLNNEADFLNLTTFSLRVFQTQIIAPIKAIMEYPRHQIIQWLHTDEIEFIQARNGRKPELSIEDRMMRCLMFNRNSNVKLLEVMFGQKKSIIYNDVWLLMQVICKISQSKFKLPFKGTREYVTRVGAGILGDAFPSAVYVMDGHNVKFEKIIAAQLFFL